MMLRTKPSFASWYARRKIVVAIPTCRMPVAFAGFARQMLFRSSDGSTSDNVGW